MDAIEFSVQGSAPTPYNVTFMNDSGEVTAFCTCPAGSNGTTCKHRTNILAGIPDGVVSPNTARIQEVLGWLPGSLLAASLAELKAAEEAVASAMHSERVAKKKLAEVMRGHNRSASAHPSPPTSAPPVKPVDAPIVVSSAKAPASARGRRPLDSIKFTDRKGAIGGYASGWYFWVHTAFQEALDIRTIASIDKAKTAVLRDQKSLELTGMTHTELKKKIEASGKALSSSNEHKQIMKFSVSDGGILTEAVVPRYEFRVTDGLESRSGKWYVQVTQTAETDGAPNSVGFTLYGRSPAESGGSMWEKKKWFSTTQDEFVKLLRFGHCDVIDLDDPPLFEIHTVEPTGPVTGDTGHSTGVPPWEPNQIN